MCAVVDRSAHNRATGKLSLVDCESYASQMGGRYFIDVDLGKGKEPTHGNAYSS